MQKITSFQKHTLSNGMLVTKITSIAQNFSVSKTNLGNLIGGTPAIQVALKINCTGEGYDKSIKEGAVEDEIKNMPMRSLSDFNTSSEYAKWKSHIVRIMDATKCTQYRLITSNYPIVEVTNPISKNIDGLLHPLSPGLLFFLISPESLSAFEALKNERTVSDFVINTNIAILNNHKNRALGIKYEIYSTTKVLKEILPERIIRDYFSGSPAQNKSKNLT